ncbi:hypothetical protein AAFF_G00040010 [Aldrovandia affinis]|uniref:Uncharacterized protein n=1 Tax=Aldrovandia affinis TaxID=143900 RepID=A0AAD7S2Y4_9TELE|nr:hypothetical protein AAFF_G00040010 [Aldrovandia affinis]
MHSGVPLSVCALRRFGVQASCSVNSLLKPQSSLAGVAFCSGSEAERPLAETTPLPRRLPAIALRSELSADGGDMPITAAITSPLD